MAKHSWLWILGLVLGFSTRSFVLPKFSAQSAPRTVSRIAPRTARISRTAVGLSSFSTGATLLEKIDKDRSLGPLEELGCEVGMPDVNDLPEITALMVECFDRTLEKKRWDADKMGPFGGLAQYANAFIDQNEVNGIANGVQIRLDSTLQLQSLRRPIKQDQTVALVARIKQGGPLIAYVEICILPDDGRRPETDNGKMQEGTTRQPYLSNLCVGLPYRRSGIGRAMLALAEDVVRFIWKDERMYLHIDNYGPAKKLYESEGFVATGPTDSEDVTHMMKELPALEEEEIEDDSDETYYDDGLGLEESDEADTNVKALPEAPQSLESQEEEEKVEGEENEEKEEKEEREEKEEKEEKIA